MRVTLAPAAAGTLQSFALPRGTERFVAIRAVGGQGNLGPSAVLDTASARKHARPPATCAAFGPQSTLSARGKTLRGRSTARACGGAGIARVLIEVFRASGQRCQFVQQSGRLTKARSCSKPVYLAAAVRGARFSLRLRRSLPAGRYSAVAIAVDTAGRVELPERFDSVSFRMR